MTLYALQHYIGNLGSSYGQPQHLYNDINEAYQEVAHRNAKGIYPFWWGVVERETNPLLILDSISNILDETLLPSTLQYLVWDGYAYMPSNLSNLSQQDGYIQIQGKGI